MYGSSGRRVGRSQPPPPPPSPSPSQPLFFLPKNQYHYQPLYPIFRPQNPNFHHSPPNYNNNYNNNNNNKSNNNKNKNKWTPPDTETIEKIEKARRDLATKFGVSNCVINEDNEWVPLLKNWKQQTRDQLPVSLLQDSVITDFLETRDNDCGPNDLVRIMTAVCNADCLKTIKINWVFNLLNILFLSSVNDDVIVGLVRELRFIPLLDGSYASVNEGAVWLHKDEHGFFSFGKLYMKLRVVNPALFDGSVVENENVTQMLFKFGVQRLSAHEVMKVCVLPAVCDEKVMVESVDLVIEYFSFIMFHLESECSKCRVEREHVMSRLRNSAFVLTNHGIERLVNVPIHFSKEFGNPVDMSKLVGGSDMKWFEIDVRYLEHPVYKFYPGGTLKWRKFMQELGVTDFVQIDKVEKRIVGESHTRIDYCSQELRDLVSLVSSSGDRDKGMYLLEVLHTLWDEYFSFKLRGWCSINGQYTSVNSSVLRVLRDFRWLASSMDDQLHFPKDLFHDCKKVSAVLGDMVPYAVPKVNHVTLFNDIGCKTTVALDDALSILKVWRTSEIPFRASISQMSKFYRYIRNEMSISKPKIMENLQSQAFIFVAYSFSYKNEVSSGLFLSPKEVYWHDSTGLMKKLESTDPQFDGHMTHYPFNKMLCTIYPSLRNLFVDEFGVAEDPSVHSYLQSLLQLAAGTSPSQAAKTIFQVFQKWSVALDSGVLSSEDIDYLKKRMEEKEVRILPTVQDKWVSLHQSFGLLCWCDDNKLKDEFKNLNNIDFLCLGVLTNEEKQMLQDKVSVLFQRLGIPSLSELLTREAICEGPTASGSKCSLVSRALLYAQRYFYSHHPSEYSEFKLSVFKSLSSLRIVVVKKLFYKNTLKRYGIESNKQCECSCLLQDTILYATPESDSLSLFIELSRFLVGGILALPLANFLQIITTMAESGSTEDQIEAFFTNCEKLLKLPSEEPQWSILSMPSSEEDKDTPTKNSVLSLDDSNSGKSTAKKLGKKLRRKTASGSDRASETKTSHTAQMRQGVTEDLIESNSDWIAEENPVSMVSSVILEKDEALKDRSGSVDGDTLDMSIGFKDQLHLQPTMVSSDINAGFSAIKANSSVSVEKDQLSCSTVTPQPAISGGTGELVDFKSAQLGEKSVKSVNEVKMISNEEKSTKIIECIRREEFGLDPDIMVMEDSILKKQHARLGRALHHLSQELYSQDSHFILELVQNADDNVYACDVEPTLTFILQEAGVIVLNNEQGFSAENIKALCDVGNSTKKEASAGYIGKKGIGFKSVFRVTDAPEIHSNGFHIKFDITEGQIGFVLPTVVPPCDVNFFSNLVSVDGDPTDEKRWNTCIVLPFRSKKNEAFTRFQLISMFSDLHPSLLLFLHRLECIKFRNLLNDSLVVMRKQVVGDGIVNVTLGKEKMSWFVKSCKLRVNHIRHDVQTTEISIAFMLEDFNNENYIPKIDNQPVFAFLPLRSYGLKFIIQADFVLPSSREEVDGDSPWNRYLLSEFPNLFVSSQLPFCSLPCFKENPGKGVSVFMSFVPLGGEVQGVFSRLPRLITSKLRTSKCLLLEGSNNEWMLPSKVLRNWTEQTRSLLPDSLIKKHLGLGYLNKDVVLSDALARALGVEECGPNILLQIMTSISRSGTLKSMGLSWLSSWLNVLYLMLPNGTQSNVMSLLGQLPFIPLLDGRYASINGGAIWLHTDKNGLEAFGKLYSKLRIVDPALLNDSLAENISQMLFKVGVQRLSPHEVLKVHILPAISDEKAVMESTESMIEYLSFIMFHLESPCTECLVEKERILSQLRNKAFICTNHGYKRLVDVPIHFGKEFGNPVDMSKLVGGTDMKWFEIDTRYLKHQVCKSLPGGMLQWRKFLQELGVTDFVQILQVEKPFEYISHPVNAMSDNDCIPLGYVVKDWDSQELTDLLSHVSSNGDKEKGKYLLAVLDTLWDDYFSDKPFKSSIIRILCSVRWLASSMDDQLHFPKDLFHDCETVRAVLGDSVPYAIPLVSNVKLLNDIRLKHTVTLDDALSVLKVWRISEEPFKASISQMSKFYTYLWNEMSISKQKIVENLHACTFIFAPYSFGSMHEEVSGLFVSPSEVCWHDPTGSLELTPDSVELTKSTHHQFYQYMTHRLFSKMLCNVYPGLHNFFVNEFGVAENPPLLSYLQGLLQLSTRNSPSHAAKTVFKVFQKWSDGLDLGFLSDDDINYLKKSMEEKEMRILPTIQDKWTSLHQSFGLLCWCDDEQLRKEFSNLKSVDFLCLGELSTDEKQILQNKVSVLFRRLGIPSLSEVVTRKAIYDYPSDNSFNTSLVNWALPYAQRYIYSIHSNEYSELKLSGFNNLSSLRIMVVEKLYYKNVIKRFGIESNNRCECDCLIQDNILYATRKSDSHTLFMELSRFLVPGISELHLANFLHMITTMAKSGFTEEKMEIFIRNSQKLPKLPSEESQWSISSRPSLNDDKDARNVNSGFLLDNLNPSKATTKSRGRIWPPVHWKPTPAFEYAQTTPDYIEELVERFGRLSISTPSVTIKEDEALKDLSDSKIHRDYSSDMNAGVSGITRYYGPKINSSNSIKRYHQSCGPQQVISGRRGEFVAFKSTKREETRVNEVKESVNSSISIQREKLNLGTQHLITGRTGELEAFKYFSAKLGEKTVKWVNEVKESGLPYDIVVEGEDDSKEYIEVKATSLARKDWFGISTREWQFAVERGESFSIACVVLSAGKLPQITTYRDPGKLCQSGHLQLGIRSSKS